MTPDDDSDELEPRRDDALARDDEAVDPAEVLPPEAREAVYELFQQFRYEFSGPLPPPHVLTEYNDALPDGADRIVRMAERQSRHRQGLETRGQWFGFILALTVVVGGIVLIAVGKQVEGLVALVGSLATLTGLFIYREVRERQPPPGQQQVPPNHQNNEGSS